MYSSGVVHSGKATQSCVSSSMPSGVTADSTQQCANCAPTQDRWCRRLMCETLKWRMGFQKMIWRMITQQANRLHYFSESIVTDAERGRKGTEGQPKLASLTSCSTLPLRLLQHQHHHTPGTNFSHLSS
ncbi:unnamed protein product [Calypogeia fissa]